MKPLNFKRLERLERLAMLGLLVLALLGCGKREAGPDQASDESSAALPNATRSSRAAREGAARVSSRDAFESSLRAAKEMTNPEERSAALVDLARQWLENRPDLAERVLLEMPGRIKPCFLT